MAKKNLTSEGAEELAASLGVPSEKEAIALVRASFGGYGKDQPKIGPTSRLVYKDGQVFRSVYVASAPRLGTFVRLVKRGLSGALETTDISGFALISDSILLEYVSDLQILALTQQAKPKQNPRAVLRPLQELEGISTPRAAQNLYRRLGQRLSGVGARGERALMNKGWREEAMEARRRLEEQFGDTVRLTSTTVRSPESVGGLRTMPTWSMRPHFTVTKPEQGKISAPYILYIPLNPETFEPLDVFYETPGRPRALLSALQAAATLRATRQTSRLGASRAVLLQEQLDQAKALAAQLQPVVDEHAALIKRIKLIEERLDQLHGSP